MSVVQVHSEAPLAGIAHLVERRLAKAEVAGSSPVSRSTMQMLPTGSVCIVGSNPAMKSPCGKRVVATTSPVSVFTETKGIEAPFHDLLNQRNLIRHHSQAVRQRSAKSPSPVRFWMVPPKKFKQPLAA